MSRSPQQSDKITLAAVGCSGSKYETANLLPAKDRYKGAYWTNKRKYGQVCADAWQIISAQYGLLAPDTEIPYYERTPSDLTGVPVDTGAQLPTGVPVTDKLDAWGFNVHTGLKRWLNNITDGTQCDHIRLEVLLGTQYREPLEARGVFTDLATTSSITVTVTFPFQDIEAAQGGMFQQIGWMNSAVERAEQSS